MSHFHIDSSTNSTKPSKSPPTLLLNVDGQVFQFGSRQKNCSEPGAGTYAGSSQRIGFLNRFVREQTIKAYVGILHSTH